MWLKSSDGTMVNVTAIAGRIFDQQGRTFNNITEAEAYYSTYTITDPEPDVSGSTNHAGGLQEHADPPFPERGPYDLADAVPDVAGYNNQAGGRIVSINDDDVGNFKPGDNFGPGGDST